MAKKEEKIRSARIEQFRKKIDELDRVLIETLAERHKTVGEIFRDKVDEDERIRDVHRESELLEKIRALADESDLDPYFAEKLFYEILSQSRRFQAFSLVDHQNIDEENDQVKVAYQGAAGAFSDEAAKRHFSERYSQVHSVGFKTFEQAATSVEEHKADYAILPIENTTAGSINQTYDLLAEKKLHIVGEEVLQITHCLMAPDKVKLENIRRILSHPQAIAQCSRFLSELLRCKVESYYDTAMAAQKVKEDNDLSQAAIASSHAAKLYGLHILRKDIANQKENYTRFVIVGRKSVEVDARIPCKSSLVFATPHEKGALTRCLKVLDDYGINMTKLESRPWPGKPWQYRFFLDIEGNMSDPAVEKGIRELEGRSVFMKVLGCYPVQD